MKLSEEQKQLLVQVRRLLVTSEPLRVESLGEHGSMLPYSLHCLTNVMVKIR